MIERLADSALQNLAVVAALAAAEFALGFLVGVILARATERDDNVEF